MKKLAENEIIARDPEDVERTNALWRNSALAATGLSAMAILVDQIRSQRRKREAIANREAGTLTFSLPPTVKKASPLKELITAAAIGGGTFYGWNALYNELRRRQLKKEIDEADAGYVEALQGAAPEKQASGDAKGFGFKDYLMGAGPDLTFLAALAAAGGTYGLLEHTFPRASEKPKAGLPKKIVVKGYGTVLADGPGDGPLGESDKEEKEKPTPLLEQISMPFGKRDQKVAAEMLTALLAEIPQVRMAKSAMISIVGAHAQNPEGFVSACKEAGADAIIDLSKGGEEYYEQLSPLGKRAAIHAAYETPMLSSALALLAWSELGELSPDMMKRAQAVAEDEDYSAVMTKVASLLYLSESLLMADEENIKTASTDNYRQFARKQMGTLGISESVDAGGEMDESDSAYQDAADPIDEFMAGKRE